MTNQTDPNVESDWKDAVLCRQARRIQDLEQRISTILQALNDTDRPIIHLENDGVLMSSTTIRIIRDAASDPLNLEGLRDQTGIENKAWKE